MTTVSVRFRLAYCSTTQRLCAFIDKAGFYFLLECLARMRSQTVIETQNILELIAREQPYLNTALRRVTDYILELPNQAKSIPIHQLAEVCGVAESSVTRFVKVIA